MIDPVRARVGLLVPRFTVFDGALGPERVDRLRARHAALARLLEPFAEVVAIAPIEDDAEIGAVRTSFLRTRVEVVIVAPSMAAPPSLGHGVLAPGPWPAVIWNAIA